MRKEMMQKSSVRRSFFLELKIIFNWSTNLIKKSKTTSYFNNFVLSCFDVPLQIKGREKKSWNRHQNAHMLSCFTNLPSLRLEKDQGLQTFTFLWKSWFKNDLKSKIMSLCHDYCQNHHFRKCRIQRSHMRRSLFFLVWLMMILMVHTKHVLVFRKPILLIYKKVGIWNNHLWVVMETDLSKISQMLKRGAMIPFWFLHFFPLRHRTTILSWVFYQKYSGGTNCEEWGPLIFFLHICLP